jgi:hypothetical protein
MNILRRTWVFSEGQSNSWCIWDLGDEMWELKNEILRHFRVISRVLLSPQTLEETVEILCDCPIPLEAIERRSAGVGWTVSEEVIRLALASAPSAPAPSAPSAPSAPAPSAHSALHSGTVKQEEVQERVGARKKIQQPVRYHQQPQAPSEESSGREMQGFAKQQPAKQQYEMQKKAMSASSPSLLSVSSQPAYEKRKSQKEKQVQKPKASTPVSSTEDNKSEQGSQSSYSSRISPSHSASANSKQLWSSLSEWIPSSALYQPSLHSQAFLEISEKPIHIFVSPTGNAASHRRHTGRHNRPKQLPLLIV